MSGCSKCGAAIIRECRCWYALTFIGDQMKISKMFLLTAVVMFGAPAFAEVCGSANTSPGEMERTTGYPNYVELCWPRTTVEVVPMKEAPKKAEPAAPKKFAPPPVKVEPKETKCEDKPITAESKQAVGKPCQTTNQFIDSLQVSPEEKSRMKAAVEKAK